MLQELQVKLGSCLPFAKASELLLDVFAIDSNPTQLWRCCCSAGQQLDEQTLLQLPEALHTLQRQQHEQNLPQKVYVMIYGSMLHIDGRWQEVKVARIFAHSSDVQQELNSSCYCAHIGHHSGFTAKLDVLLSQLQGELVFINDGATWIGHYISSRYPQPEQLFDFYHVMEKIAAAGKDCGAGKAWLQQQYDNLLDSQYGKLVHALERLKWKDRKLLKKLRQYLLSNQKRMNYRSYRQQGLGIGSGPVEAAHRCLLQQRMKLSGQRWKGRRSSENDQAAHRLR